MKSYFQCENKIPLPFPDYTAGIKHLGVLYFILPDFDQAGPNTVLNINTDNEKLCCGRRFVLKF
jgi:hypothetical protein